MGIFGFDEFDCLGSRASGGEHGIDDDSDFIFEAREFAVVGASFGGFFVSFETDITHGDIGEEFQEWFEHGKSGAKDGDDSERRTEFDCLGLFERGFDGCA